MKPKSLSRRRLIAGTSTVFAAPVFGLGFFALSEPPTISEKPATIDYSPAADSLREILHRAPQFTFIDDTNHDDGREIMILANDKFLSNCRMENIQNIFVEVSYLFRDDAVKVATGAMTPEQFLRRLVGEFRGLGYEMSPYRQWHFLSIAQLFQNAPKHEIQVICADKQFDNLRDHVALLIKLETLQKRWGESLKKFADDSSRKTEFLHSFYRNVRARLTGEKGLENYVQARSASWAEMESNFRQHHKSDDLIFAEYDKAVVERLSYDKTTAQNIRQIAREDKSIVCYGNAHGTAPCGLRDELNAYQIATYPTRLRMLNALPYLSASRGELANSFVILTTGKTFSRDEIRKLIPPQKPIFGIKRDVCAASY